MIKELVKKTLYAHIIEAEESDAYAPSVDEQIAVARLVDSYTRISSVIEAEKRLRMEEEERREIYQTLLDRAADYIREKGVPLVLMQLVAQFEGPPESHVPEEVAELSRAMGAEAICMCPTCIERRKREGR